MQMFHCNFRDIVTSGRYVLLFSEKASLIEFAITADSNCVFFFHLPPEITQVHCLQIIVSQEFH